MLPLGNDDTLFGGPKVDVLLTDGGGHHAGEQVWSTGEGRDAEAGEFGGEGLVVEWRAFIAQGEKGDDLYAGLYKLVGALEQVLFHAAFVEVGNEHKNGVARIADQRLAVAHRAVDVRAAAELDADIEKYARGWRFERISLVASAIMRVAMYEILYMADIPQGAAISEAVTIAKKYETPEVAKFINGILGSFARGEVKEKD